MDSKTTFRLKFGLRLANSFRSSEVALWATQIASRAAELQTKHGISIWIDLQPFFASSTAPTPRVLQLLAPFLHSIGMYAVPFQQTTDDYAVYHLAKSAFTPAHLAALQHCSDALSALCISDTVPQHGNVRSLAGHMADVAQLTSLTKLHLSLDQSQPANFTALSQLSSVQDLALQNRFLGVTCSGILESSSQTPRHIILSADSWSVDTYLALQHVQHLQRLLLKLYRLHVGEAFALAGVRATHIHLDLRCCNLYSRLGLAALSEANPRSCIHELTLWGLDNDGSRHLQMLPSLQNLTVVNSLMLTGSVVGKLTEVSELRIIDCPNVTALGVRHMLRTALPSLQKIAFLAGSNTCSTEHLQVDQSFLQSLLYGRSLACIDLRGVRGLSLAAVQQFESAVEARQALTRAQSSLRHAVLYDKQHVYQPNIAVSGCCHTPAFYQLSEPVSDSSMSPQPTMSQVVAAFLLSLLVGSVCTQCH